MLQHFLESFVFGIFYNPVKFTIFIASLILSIIFLYYSSKTRKIKTKIALIYLHVLFFIVPLTIMAFSTSCKIPIFNCTTQQFIGFVLGTGAFIFILGFFLIPNLYIIINKNRQIKDKSLLAFIKKHSNKLNIKYPKLFYINSAKPYAYSFKSLKSAIFISVGMFEIFSKKEIQSVILHELYHIKQRSSLYKFSAIFLRTFSITASFLNLNKSLQDEENKADSFAIEIQNTSKYIKSAKAKISSYLSKT